VSCPERGRRKQRLLDLEQGGALAVQGLRPYAEVGGGALRTRRFVLLVGYIFSIVRRSTTKAR
jgi:hypothetical protein